MTPHPTHTEAVADAAASSMTGANVNMQNQLGSITNYRQVSEGRQALIRHAEASRKGRLPIVVTCKCGWEGIIQAFDVHQMIAAYEAMRAEEGDESATVEDTLMARSDALG